MQACSEVVTKPTKGNQHGSHHNSPMTVSLLRWNSGPTFKMENYCISYWCISYIHPWLVNPCSCFLKLYLHFILESQTHISSPLRWAILSFSALRLQVNKMWLAFITSRRRFIKTGTCYTGSQSASEWCLWMSDHQSQMSWRYKCSLCGGRYWWSFIAVST